METGIVVALAAAASAILSSFITSTFQKPKTAADAHASIATGASTAVDMMTDVLEEVRTELRKAHLEIEKLRVENKELRRVVEHLTLKVSELDRRESRS